MDKNMEHEIGTYKEYRDCIGSITWQDNFRKA